MPTYQIRSRVSIIALAIIAFLFIASSCEVVKKEIISDAIDINSGYGAICLNEEREKVVSTLGNPDEVRKYEDVDFYLYKSKGFEFSVHNSDNRVHAIFFYPGFKAFRTKEGLGPQATFNDVKRVYGPPKKEFETRIEYEGFDFRIENGKLVRIGIWRTTIPGQSQ